MQKIMFKCKSLLKASSLFDSLLQQKRHTYFLGMLFLFSCILKQVQAQHNFVPNHSFEQYTNCPSAVNIDEYRNSKPDYWYKPDMRGAAYVNSCADSLSGVPIHSTVGGNGFQYARTGVAYVGMFYRNSGNRRNYFQVKLNDSLEAGKCYYAECYVNESNRFEVGCNNQSILLTNVPIYADTINKQIILANPQVTNYNNTIITDTLNWIKVSGVFIAQGGEQYLTLGNFRDDNHTRSTRFQPPGSGYDGAAYYVDDVSVYALDSLPLKADAGPDTTIALGDSVFIGSLTNGIPNITWYNMAGNVIDTGRPGFYVTPATNTSYIIEQTVCGYYSRDTVTVTVNLLPLHWLTFTAAQLSSSFTSPNGGQVEEGQGKVLLKWQTANEVNVSHINIQRSFRGTDAFENIGQVTAKNKPYNAYSEIVSCDWADVRKYGSALFRLQSVDRDGYRSYSEIRRVAFNTQMSRLNIYPNPAKRKVNIAYAKMKEITITDVTGRVVLSKVLQGINAVQVDVSLLPKGMFIVKVVGSNGESEAEKLVIE